MVIGWKGWACTPPPPPARADFSIMMGCTPEIGNHHSVCTLWFLPSKDYFCILILFRLDFSADYKQHSLSSINLSYFLIPTNLLCTSLKSLLLIFFYCVLHSLHAIHTLQKHAPWKKCCFLHYRYSTLKDRPVSSFKYCSFSFCRGLICRCS